MSEVLSQKSNVAKLRPVRSVRSRLVLVLAAVLALSAIAMATADAATEWVGRGTSLNRPDPNWSDTDNFIEATGPAGEYIFPLLHPRDVACSTEETCYESHNDAGDPDIGSIRFDDGEDYKVTGNGILLDEGFLAEPDAESVTAFEKNPNKSPSPGCAEWATPLALTKAQTWRFKGPFCGIDFRGSVVDGNPDDHFPLTIDLGDPSEEPGGKVTSAYTGGLAMDSVAALGNVVVNGENSASDPMDNGIFSFGVPHAGEEPGSLDYPGTSVPAYEAEGTSLTLNTVQWEGSGASTAIRSVDSEASIGDQFETTSASASSGVELVPAGTLAVHGDVTFSAGPTAKPGDRERNHLYFFATGADSPPTPGTDYSQLSATGKVDLGEGADLGDYNPELLTGASLFISTRLAVDVGSPVCKDLPAGTTYTLIHADEGVTGEFANAPQDAVVPVGSTCNGDSGPGPENVPTEQGIKIEYGPDDVTATVLDEPESVFELEEYVPGSGGEKEGETKAKTEPEGESKTGGGSPTPSGGSPPSAPLSGATIPPSLPVVLPTAPLILPPPNTTIGKVKVAKDKAKITFSGAGGVGKLKFLCQLDKAKKEKPCSSPETFSKLSPGKHTLRVRAVDSRGVSDPTPASVSFKIKS